MCYYMQRCLCNAIAGCNSLYPGIVEQKCNSLRVQVVNQRKGTMRTHQQWLGLFVNRSASNFLAKCSAAAILGLLFLGVTLGVNAGKAHAPSFATCGSGDRASTVVGGDTMVGI